jgi:hypothetical protein
MVTAPDVCPLALEYGRRHRAAEQFAIYEVLARRPARTAAGTAAGTVT